MVQCKSGRRGPAIVHVTTMAMTIAKSKHTVRVREHTHQGRELRRASSMGDMEPSAGGARNASLRLLLLVHDVDLR